MITCRTRVLAILIQPQINFALKPLEVKTLIRDHVQENADAPRRVFVQIELCEISEVTFDLRFDVSILMFGSSFSNVDKNGLTFKKITKYLKFCSFYKFFTVLVLSFKKLYLISKF